MYYFDTSALIKRYIKETGSQRVSEIFNEGLEVFTSSITYAEVYATLSRLRHEGYLSEKDLQKVHFDFEVDWAKIAIVEFSNKVRLSIPKIIKQVRLRGADLIHLVSLSFLLESDMQVSFICSDKRLLNACSDLDLQSEEPK